MFCSAEGPEEERVLVLHFQAGDRRLLYQRLARRRAGRGQQRRPPSAVLRLELRVKEQRRKRMALSIIALQPGIVRFGREPEREVDREMRVNALGLHRLDDLDGVLDFGRVNLPALIEVAAVNPHQVDAVLGQHPRALPQVRARQLVRRAVDGPEPHRLAGPAVNELAVLHADEALLAGEPLIEEAQINRAALGKGVRLRVERKPVLGPAAAHATKAASQTEPPRQKHRFHMRPILSLRLCPVNVVSRNLMSPNRHLDLSDHD